MQEDGRQGTELSPDEPRSAGTTSNESDRLNEADNEDLLARQVLAVLQAVMAGAVSGQFDEARINALADQGVDIAAGLSEGPQALMKAQLAIARAQALGIVTGRVSKRYKEALEHFEEALRIIQEERDALVQVSGPDVAELRDSLETQELDTRLSIAKLKVGTAQGVEREELERVIGGLQGQLGARAGPGILYRSISELRRAVALFEEGSRLLGEMDLDRAAETVSRAQRVVAEINSSLELLMKDKDVLGPLHPIIADLAKSYSGFGKVLGAVSRTVETLRDTVLGDAKQSHLSALDEADSLLEEGWQEVDQGLTAASMASGQTLDRQPVQEMFETLRRRVSNLRQLVRAALAPKQRARNAAPLIVPLFLITFVLGTIGLRISGLVTKLGGWDLLVLAAIALVIAFAGAFGPKVGLSALSGVSRWFSRSAEEPSGEDDS